MSAELVEWFLSQPRHSANTRRAYRSDLAELLAWLEREESPIVAFDGLALSQYAAELGNRRPRPAPATIARKLSAVRALIRFAFGAERVPQLAFPSRVVRRLPDVPTPDDVDDILATLDGNTPIRVRNRAVFELIYSCGLRAQEACDLKLSDLLVDRRLLIVHGKGQRERAVPFGDEARHHLQRYLRIRPDLSPHTPHVFVSKTGRQLQQSDLYRAVRNPHRLRHAYATHLLEGGADLRVIQRLLGHASPSTTEIYTRLQTGHLRQAHAKAHPRS